MSRTIKIRNIVWLDYHTQMAINQFTQTHFNSTATNKVIYYIIKWFLKNEEIQKAFLSQVNSLGEDDSSFNITEINKQFVIECPFCYTQFQGLKQLREHIAVHKNEMA